VTDRRRFILFLMAGLGAAGCATRAPSVGGLDPEPATPYTLASGDRLRIIVFGQDNLSNVYAVDGAGRITMPLIGSVPAIGLTTQQLARAIEGHLRQGYVREPRVTVEVDSYRPFFILGEVQTSGQYPFVSGMTVQTAVAIAGGFAPRARRSSATITRRIGSDTVTAEVPITFPVQPGDTILIGERWF
jgi:polysaccharide export outer membrane protein